jgi:hypothetical protein
LSSVVVHSDELRVALDGGLQVDVRVFSSGGVSADIRYGKRFVVLDGTRDGEWGVSDTVDAPEDSGGYEEVHDALTDAVLAVVGILGTRPGVGAGEAAGDDGDP